MNKDLIKILESIKETVLAIGIDEKMAEVINKNNKIVKCDILNGISTRKERKIARAKKQKTIDIKKLREIYKKKKVDYIVCEYSQIEKYLNTFVKDSIYINRSKLYFYGNVNEELILKKYKRYDTLIEVKKYRNGYIIEIDNSNSKNNVFKEFSYKIIDGFTNLIEIIGDILMG